MAGNATPQFTKQGHIEAVLITAANTSSDGTGTIGTDIFKAFTADVDNGSYVDRIRFVPVASAPTTTTATIARIFLSSKTAGATTPADTFLFQEVQLPIANADNATAVVVPVEVQIGIRLPKAWTVLVTQHAAPVALTNWRPITIAGDY